MTKAFVDTTIHVDRVLLKRDTEYMGAVRRVCANYDICITSTFSKLEFKNVVLMDLQCVAQWIEEEDSFAEAYNRAMRVRSRRHRTLANIAAFVQLEVDTMIAVERGESLDAELKEQGLTFIHNAIEFLWIRFDLEVNQVVDNMRCKRVLEGPIRRKSGKVSVRNQHSKCLSMSCNNRGVFESHALRIVKLVEELRAMAAAGDERMTDELREIVSSYDHVQSNTNRLYNYDRCIGLGDLWIHLEAVKEGATALITRNYKESNVLCESLKLEMVDPSAADSQDGPT